MAAEDGPAVHPLIQALESEPCGFSFFQAVRLLERSVPDATPLGGPGPAQREALRLRPSSSLAFQASDVESVERREGEGPRWLVTTPVLGLYGAGSPLPCFYSEDILRREVTGEDDPVRLFLDVLHHRILSLLYRAGSKYRWEFGFEPGARDRTSSLVMGLLGLGTEGLRDATEVPAARLLRYAGYLWQQPKSGVFLAGVVSDYFDDAPVRVESAVLRRVAIPADQRARLGLANATLGGDLVLGESVPDRAGKCRIAVGPLDLEGYQAFLPAGRHGPALDAVLRLLLPDPLVHDVRLVIKGRSVPRLRVGSGGDAARLGWTSWLRHEPVGEERGELFASTGPWRH